MGTKNFKLRKGNSYYSEPMRSLIGKSAENQNIFVLIVGDRKKYVIRTKTAQKLMFSHTYTSRLPLIGVGRDHNILLVTILIHVFNHVHFSVYKPSNAFFKSLFIQVLLFYLNVSAIRPFNAHNITLSNKSDVQF